MLRPLPEDLYLATSTPVIRSMGTVIHFLFVSIESWSFQFYLLSVERGLLSNIDNDNESMQAFLRRRIFLQIVEIEICESSCLDKGIPSVFSTCISRGVVSKKRTMISKIGAGMSKGLQ